jgi:malate-CoA ligase subunit beta
MDIHEYQAKKLLAEFGVTSPKGDVAYHADQASYIAQQLGGSRWVVKAQVHAGGRGKAGGVKLCNSLEEVRQVANQLLGSTLVTHQTSSEGKPVNRLYIEVAEPYTKELYLGVVLDRKSQRIHVIASSQGGMDIEEVAQNHPESILQVEVEPAVGLQSFQARQLAYGLGISPKASQRVVSTIMGCYKALRQTDASMVEINPLAITSDDRSLALDAKMSFDDNALFRQPKIAELRDPEQEDSREAQAHQHGLNYVGLSGDIGCIINGAGLAMATMDMIKYAGGEPANFLDVGGGASPERVAEAFRLVLSDPNVKAILVNIFAGINRCDWVAQGVVQAAKGLKVPLIVRLAGTHVQEGQAIIMNSGLPIISANSLADAATKAVNAANQYSKN